LSQAINHSPLEDKEVLYRRGRVFVFYLTPTVLPFVPGRLLSNMLYRRYIAILPAVYFSGAYIA
jgi:hypothetical protein